MKRVLLPLVLGLGICYAGTAEPTPPIGPSVTTQPGGKKAKPRQRPADLTGALDTFHQALRADEWERALALCSAQTKERAKEYASAERYFRDYVPIDALLAETEYHTCGGGTDKMGLVREDLFVRLPGATDEETVGWVWYMEKVDGVWLVRPPDVPVAEYKKRDIDRRRRQKEEADAKWRRLEPKLEGLRTQLTALQDEFRVGRPMLFRLELVNEGRHELSYDHQSVAVNASMTITAEDNRMVPYTRGPVQTGEHDRPIQPGTTVVLFDALDVARDYDLTKPGKYRIQFNGRGLEISDARGVDNGAARRKFPSNVVEIDVKP
jgi:hypothetical protein